MYRQQCPLPSVTRSKYAVFMGRTSTVFCLAAFLASSAMTRGQETLAFQDVAFTAAFDGTRQLYVIGLPPGFKADSPHDILIALHGHGSDRWQYARDPRDECRATRDVAIKHGLFRLTASSG